MRTTLDIDDELLDKVVELVKRPKAERMLP